jgi:dihydropteroate synthase
MRDKPKVMGIINTTKDSFFSPSICSDRHEGARLINEMVEQGADILDIGGESTSFGRFAKGKEPLQYKRVSEEEELANVIPVIEEAARLTSLQISVDTMRANVARKAIAAGATLLNDQTGFTHPDMRAVAAENDVDLCVMHMQGTPATMQLNPHYEEGVMEALKRFFDQQITLLTQAGVSDERIILDPGIGFGNTLEHNYTMLQQLPQLKIFGLRILIGLSRKSLMTRLIGKPASELLPPTIALNTLAIAQGGADIIRVHDVAEHRDVVDTLYLGGYCNTDFSCENTARSVTD